MEIPFAIRGVAGRVVVSYEVNRQPESVGCQPETRGFPVCLATVERPLRGYDSGMGWVAWDEIPPVLRAEHKGWGFPPGFAELA